MKLNRFMCFTGTAVLAAALAAGCSRDNEKSAPPGEAGAAKEGAAMTIQLTSKAFEEGATIPKVHTCDAEDVSPPLMWSNVPEGAKSLALICDDPDAPMGTWVHWVLYDLPADVTGLPQGVPMAETLDNGAKQGVTDFRRVGYGGPCPPPGKPHRYFFKLYAIDKNLGLEPGVKKSDVLKAMEGHVLAEGQLMGTYGR